MRLMHGRQLSQKDLAVGTMMVAFRSAHGAATSYLGGGSAMRSGGTAAIATIHLLTRGLVDVAVAQRIAAERHPIQAHSVLRAAWEAALLIDLFHAEPELADDWTAGKHWMFSPAKVRTRLGEEEDNFYSYMCARSHPRFAGFQMSIFRMVGAPDGHATHFTEIPFEVPDSFMAVAAPSIVLAKLAVLAGHVNFNDTTHKRTSLARMLRTAADELATGWSAMDGALTEEERADPGVHDLADRAAWFRDHLTTLADTIDWVYDE
jgi:hypothetical protein